METYTITKTEKRYKIYCKVYNKEGLLLNDSNLDVFLGDICNSFETKPNKAFLEGLKKRIAENIAKYDNFLFIFELYTKYVDTKINYINLNCFS